jgi:hypothetical protein
MGALAITPSGLPRLARRCDPHCCAEDCGFDRLLLLKNIRRTLGR